MYGFIKDVFLQIKKDTDIKYILLILLIGLAVYIPYILSFNSADSSRHYWTGDSWWYMNIVRSAVHDNDFDMANNIPENIHVIQGQLAMSSEGYLAPKHGIFFPLATIPFYLILNNAAFPLFNLLMTLGILILIYRIIRVFFNENVSLITTLIYAFTSVIMLYSYNYLSDLFSTFIFLFAVNLALHRNFYPAAFLLGLSVFAKISNIVWITPVFVYIVYDLYFTYKGKRKAIIEELLKTLILFTIGIIPLFVTNYLIYGDIFTTGYQRTVIYSMDGGLRLITHSGSFHRPFLNGLNALFFDKIYGMFWFNYILSVALAGIVFIPRLKNKLPETLLLLTVILLQIIFYSKYEYSLATEFGNRFLIITIALSSVFSANIIDLILNKFYRKPAKISNR